MYQLEWDWEIKLVKTGWWGEKWSLRLLHPIPAMRYFNAHTMKMEGGESYCSTIEEYGSYSTRHDAKMAAWKAEQADKYERQRVADEAAGWQKL